MAKIEVRKPLKRIAGVKADTRANMLPGRAESDSSPYNFQG
jgi:hypothetical protein